MLGPDPTCCSRIERSRIVLTPIVEGRGPVEPQGVHQIEEGDGVGHSAVGEHELVVLAADREVAASFGTPRHLPGQGGVREGG